MRKIICLLFRLSVVAPAMASELLAYYPLDGDYKDYAEGLYPLTPFGTPTFVAGKFGQAVLFDGPLTGTGNATEYLRNNTGLNPALANEKDFTILFWVKTTQAGYAGPEFQQPGIVSAEKGGYEDWSTFINADGRLGFYVQFLPVAWPTSTIPINDGKWHHIAVTRNNTTGNLQIYIDGVLNVERIEEGSKGNVGAGSNVYVGGQNPAEPHTQFNGEIDDVYFYNGVLTEAQIRQHFITQTDRFMFLCR